MFEAIPSINNAKEKSDQEPLVPAVELNEAELNEFRKEIANTFRVSYDGSYFKKLQRIMGAFVLAGMAVMASPSEGIAPVVSEERLVMHKFNLHSVGDQEAFNKITDSLKEKAGTIESVRLPAEPGGSAFSVEDETNSMQQRAKDQKIFKKITNSLKEKGGIVESPQLPDRIYKPGSLADATQIMAYKSETPYFLKPEIILGKDFVQKNPEKSNEYMKKIKEVIEATTMIENSGGKGSGVIVNTKMGKVVLTNEHVVGDDKEVKIKYSNNEIALAEVVAKDQKKDLAILRIIGWDADGEYGNLSTTSKALDIETEDLFKNMKPGEKLAAVGNPLGFPFETAINEFKEFDYTLNHLIPTRDERKKDNPAEVHELCEFSMINSVPDSRFNGLALYEREHGLSDEFNRIQGGTKFGMSGGPIIRLEKNGKPKLVGINSNLGIERGESKGIGKIMGKNLYKKAEPSKNQFLSIGVSAKDIQEFLSKNGY